MKIEIITPEKRLFEGEADLVQLPGIDGLFEILNNHAPMISALGKGKGKPHCPYNRRSRYGGLYRLCYARRIL